MTKQVLAAFAVLTAAAAAAIPKGFTTDFAAAKESAKTSGKRIFALFTGSDWCPWCVKLDNEILSKGDFAPYASSYFELVYLDFPRKSHQTKALRTSNEALRKKYGVSGFPTVLILDAQGNAIGKSGYMKLTPKEYVDATLERCGLAPANAEGENAESAGGKTEKAAPEKPLEIKLLKRENAKLRDIISTYERESRRLETSGASRDAKSLELNRKRLNQRTADKINSYIRSLGYMKKTGDAEKEKKLLLDEAASFKASLTQGN